MGGLFNNFILAFIYDSCIHKSIREKEQAYFWGLSFMSDVTTSKPGKGFDTSQGKTTNSSSEPIYKLLNDADWTTEFSKKLRDLSTLPSNWDSYGAEPPNKVALFWAFEILDVLSRKGFSPTTVTPSVENGIGISFIYHNKYADIECFLRG